MMKTFREYVVYRLVEDEMYTDKDVIQFMPGDVREKMSQITDKTVYQDVVNQVKQALNQAYQDFIARKGPSPNVDAIWREKAGGEQAPIRGVARALQPNNMERDIKTKIWTGLTQKLSAMGGRHMPVEITNLVNANSSRRKDFESTFVATDAFSNTRRVGGQTDVFMPFYREGSGAIKVSPNFASARYPQWHKFLSDVIENTPLQTLNKIFRNVA